MAHSSQSDPSGAVRRAVGTVLPPKAGRSLHGCVSALKFHLDISRAMAGPQDFERIKLVGQGDVGKVYLVRLCSSRDIFAMKVLSKAEMIKRNKVGFSAA
jgi:protein-serine/threonine kinase